MEHKKWNRVYVLKKLIHIVFIVTIFETSYLVHLYELPPISTAEYIQDVPSGVGGGAIGGGSDGTGVTGGGSNSLNGSGSCTSMMVTPRIVEALRDYFESK